MYSHGDRLRAVQLYIKFGKRVAATIRQLGYPTKGSLRNWYREYERHLDLPSRYARDPKYSQVQKEFAVEHYLGHGRCASATIKALGYPCRDVLAAWIRELDPQTRTRVVGRSREVTPAVKQGAVVELCIRQGSAQAVADQIGVRRPTLYNWKNQLLGQEAPASMKRKQDSLPNPERAELEQQLEALRRDVRRLQLEHDLLKKASELIKNDHRGVAPSQWKETRICLH